MKRDYQKLKPERPRSRPKRKQNRIEFGWHSKLTGLVKFWLETQEGQVSTSLDFDQCVFQHIVSRIGDHCRVAFRSELRCRCAVTSWYVCDAILLSA